LKVLENKLVLEEGPDFLVLIDQDSRIERTEKRPLSVYTPPVGFSKNPSLRELREERIIVPEKKTP